MHLLKEASEKVLCLNSKKYYYPILNRKFKSKEMLYIYSTQTVAFSEFLRISKEDLFSCYSL